MHRFSDRFFGRKGDAASSDDRSEISTTVPAPETFPSGIKLLHCPADNVSIAVDIIFVHGLTGHREKTWTAKGASEPWPKSLLPSKFPEARVLAFGYDATVADWKGVVSESRIGDHGWNLLTSLSTFREEDNTNEVPIIFVCHSLGGLVCEDALATARNRREGRFVNILRSTCGIFFLGTPHHGAGLANWAELLARYIGVVKQTNSDVVAVLRRDSEVLARIQDSFHTLLQTRSAENLRPIEITCFFEQLPLPGLGLVVQSDSAKLPGTVLIGIRADHMGMTRFSGVDDEGFKAVCGEIRSCVRKILINAKHGANVGVGSESADVPEQNKPGTPTRHFLVPYDINVDFVGRAAVLEQLKALFRYGDSGATGHTHVHIRSALHGLGGIGKTQIAIAYAYWLRDASPGTSVFWVHASSTDRFHESFASIAETCQIPHRHQAQADILRLVKNWLASKSHGPWLMIIDNADNSQLFSHPISLNQYIPECEHGAVLITTRNQQAALGLTRTQSRNVIGIDRMLDDESVLLLQAVLNDNTVSAETLSTLSSRLENLPLALVQAAAFIHGMGIPVDEYIQLLDHSDQDLVDLLSEEFETVGRDLSKPRAVAATWVLSFEQIRQQDPLASDLLSFMSLLDRQAIPEKFLERPKVRKIQLSKALGLLKAFSLIGQDRDDCFSMHRLVQLVTRKWITKRAKIQLFANQALVTLQQAYPICNGLEEMPTCRAYLPHAQAVLQLSDTYWSTDETVIKKGHLADAISLFLSADGQWLSAEINARIAVNIFRMKLGERHEVTVMGLRNLSSILYDLGRFDEAEKLDAQLIAIYGQMPKICYPTEKMLSTMSNQARNLRSQGRLKEAEELGVKILEAIEKSMGAEHPDTLTAMGNVATVFLDQGRLDGAEKLLVKVLESRTRTPGADTLSKLIDLHNLAYTWKKQGRLSDAEKLYLQVLEERKSILGPDHPLTLMCMDLLADTFKHQGRVTDAIQLLRESLDSKERVLGLDHPDTREVTKCLENWLDEAKCDRGENGCE